MRPTPVILSLILACAVSCAPAPKGPVFTLEQLTGQRVRDHRGTGKIQLHSNKQGTALFAPATVGRRKGWLQVDTGAPITLLTAEVCDATGYMETSRGHVSTPTGDRMPGSVGTIQSLDIDGVEIIAPVILRQEDDSYFRSMSKPPGRGSVFGLLGLDTLRLMNAEIDVSGQILRLGAAKSPGR